MRRVVLVVVLCISLVSAGAAFADTYTSTIDLSGSPVTVSDFYDFKFDTPLNGWHFANAALSLIVTGVSPGEFTDPFSGTQVSASLAVIAGVKGLQFFSTPQTYVFSFADLAVLNHQKSQSSILINFQQLAGTITVAQATLSGEAVPVPGAVWLFGTGLIGMAGLKRKLPG